MIRISEIFVGIQGEGKYVGTPMLFIRVSGCTRKCSWCDTKYHTKGKERKVEELVHKVTEVLFSNPSVKDICFTGGEPLIYMEKIFHFINLLPTYKYHLETNGDLIKTPEKIIPLLTYFDYISISPKTKDTAKKITEIIRDIDKIKIEWINKIDIKVVTDLEKVGNDIIKYATMLMPLTTYDEKKDKRIKRKVWEYCLMNGYKYSPRLQVDIWGKKKGK